MPVLCISSEFTFRKPLPLAGLARQASHTLPICCCQFRSSTCLASPLPPCNNNQTPLTTLTPPGSTKLTPPVHLSPTSRHLTPELSLVVPKRHPSDDKAPETRGPETGASETASIKGTWSSCSQPSKAIAQAQRNRLPLKQCIGTSPHINPSIVSLFALIQPSVHDPF